MHHVSLVHPHYWILPTRRYKRNTVFRVVSTIYPAPVQTLHGIETILAQLAAEIQQKARHTFKNRTSILQFSPSVTQVLLTVTLSST